LICVSGHVPRGVWLWNLESGTRQLPETFDGSHTNTICLAYDKRRGLLLAGSSMGFISLYELDSGILVNSIQRHHGAIRRIVIDEERDLVISGGDDGRVVIAKIG
jgi:WD40 repeat protein